MGVRQPRVTPGTRRARLHWTHGARRSSSTGRGRPSGGSSARSPSSPLWSSGRWPHARPSAVRRRRRGCGSSRSSATLGRPGTGRTGAPVSIRSGIPTEVSAYTVNLACGSGMKAASARRAADHARRRRGRARRWHGEHDARPYLLDRMRLGYRMGTRRSDGMSRDGFLDPLCGLVMGETAENLVDMCEISRDEQDEFALESRRGRGGRGTVAATRCSPSRRPGKVGRSWPSRRTSTLRPESTRDSLGKLPPVFREGGSVTAGNSSGLTDGAAAFVLMSECGPRPGTGSRWPASSGCRARACRPGSWGSGRSRPPGRCSRRPGSPRRFRPDRDQRGVRSTGDGLRARAEVRPGRG